MSRDWELQFGSVKVMPRKNHPGDFDQGFIDQNKLRDAITYAPQMVNQAFLKLSQFKRGLLQSVEAQEVQVALAKYFSIHPSDESYKLAVKGIVKVFFAIKRGLDAPYDLIVFDPTDHKRISSANGYVRPTRTTVQKGIQKKSESPIRTLLGIPDEWNHKEWCGPDIRTWDEFTSA